MANGEWMQSLFATRHSPFAPSHPPQVEGRLLPGAVAAQRALRPDRVRALEDPVLPGGEAGEDFCFHGLRAAEAQVRLHAGQRVGREARALFEEDAQLVLPVDVVEGEGDEAELLGLAGVERAARRGLRGLDGLGRGEKARLKAR